MKTSLFALVLTAAVSASASIPEPQPVKSAVEITALYYPGTEHMPEWDMVDQTCPERKPLLGWYDEGDPEAIDWQVKWAVEHGITSFCVDWYWNRGHRRLEHWVKGFQKAKFRKYLKWYMMYANHNQPGSHSTEDQVAVTKFWLDNYFKTPEYYTVDGKPAVCIWDARRIDEDFIAEAAAKGETLRKGDGVRRAFAISERMVREAGLPGIHWIDMHHGDHWDQAYADSRISMGFKEMMGYNFDTFANRIAPEAVKPGEPPKHYSFDVVTAAIGKFWQDMCSHPELPFWPVLPTGWDDRPRSFQNSRVVYGRTVEKFAAICREARKFCDRTGRKHVLILPVNEWQEGSYVEPNEEYGFGMYDAIRDAFCEKPAAGWPKNVTPQDLGMRSYDFPKMYRSPVQRWEFDRTTEGWYRQPYGGGEVENHDGCLTFVVNRLRNFNIRQRMVPFAASQYGSFRVRMKVTPNPRAGLGKTQAPKLRLKWGTAAEPIIGKGVAVDQRRSVAVTPALCDGEWHEYTLDLSANPDWKGEIDELWFEAADVMHARVAIDWMRFERGRFAAFANPPQDAKPWTYWFLTNTLTDRETITEEFADIARLGFGGMLVTDSRGYWVDDDHLLVPEATVRWGSDEWLDLFAHAIREAAKNGLRFSLNIAASGGHLRGDVDVGEDNPKFLMFRNYRPGDAFETPSIPHYREVAVFAVRTAEGAVRSAWANAGDGYYSMSASSGKRADGGKDLTVRKALEVRELASAEEGASLGKDWTIVRFGAGTIAGQEVDINVLDRTAVRRHLDRVIGKLISRVPGLVGRDRTFANLYNVSWEGAMPTWSATFEKDFEAAEGYALRPHLPALAGYDLSTLNPHPSSLLTSFRHARGVMMKNHLYGAVREWAHEHGMGAFSESGGPWQRNPQTFGECDMLSFLGANDFPQGEFWPLSESRTAEWTGHANANGRFIAKGIASAAHIYDCNIASVEAFTHMHRHWSVDPAFLKPLGDQAYADGVNLLVWHTYTSSPKRYGVPGIEYFAGSHINRNVTWHDEFPAMVTYLGRCQYLLQAGRPVTDIAVLTGDRAYTHWGCSDRSGRRKGNGRFRNLVSDEMSVRIPSGFAYDTVNDEAIARNPKLLERYAVVYDARPEANRKGMVDVGALKPDVETASDFTWCHRRVGGDDVYFIAGEGPAELTFRASAPAVEIWDAVAATRTAAQATRLDDGRTKVTLDLPVGGSCFVLFLEKDRAPSSDSTAPAARQTLALAGPWKVSFAYHPGVTAKPPAPVTLDTLVDFTTRDDLRHFAGTATYKTTFIAPSTLNPQPFTLSLGSVPTGIAHVYVNGRDCGTVWCAPWRADISSALKPGENELEIRYVNNWCNRLVGDCALPENERVTKSNLHYWTVERRRGEGNSAWKVIPTVYSGYSSYDKLQPCGLLGPIEIR